ncbi:HD domain-containing protein [Alphaproteobacteria bacterium KMM 3653]|uniref:HD domain-containing protein n=1 Tax=Harenicola maris TaxID=2841044 RepID=A0AAP2CLN3_9RHOB|nr:HD domain-containing protein [Harenicola maris]
MSRPLDAQMAFLQEADRLKSVLRATTLGNGSRRENSGEHSWHIALYALILGDHAGPGVDPSRVIRMLLIHDLVEIDAGDAPIFGDQDAAALAAEEDAAAQRIFGMLPEAQGAELLALWREFEAAESPDAVFAKSLDRLQPPMQNLASGGGSWIEYNVSPETFEARVGSKIKRGAPGIWDWAWPRFKAWFDQRAKTGG